MSDVNVNKSLCERVLKLKSELKFFTTKKMSDRFGVSKNALDQTFIFRKNPPKKVIDGLIRDFDVSRDWLLHGTGEMFTDTDGDEIDMEESLKMLAESNKIMAESNKEIIKTNSVLVKEIIRLNTKENKN